MTDTLADLWRDYQADPAFEHLRVPTGGRPPTFVPGEGEADRPPAMFVGEAPGATEDEEGRPFVGPAGRLLREMIGRHLSMWDDGVWITNLVKYRPPSNRQPTWPERMAAKPYLGREIKMVRPMVTVLLGATALSVVEPNVSISTAAGHLFERRTRGRTWRFFAMFHPSYLLRRRDMLPLANEHMWELSRLLVRLSIDEP